MINYPYVQSLGGLQKLHFRKIVKKYLNFFHVLQKFDSYKMRVLGVNTVKDLDYLKEIMGESYKHVFCFFLRRTQNGSEFFELFPQDMRHPESSLVHLIRNRLDKMQVSQVLVDAPAHQINTRMLAESLRTNKSLPQIVYFYRDFKQEEENAGLAQAQARSLSYSRIDLKRNSFDKRLEKALKELKGENYLVEIQREGGEDYKILTLVN